MAGKAPNPFGTWTAHDVRAVTPNDNADLPRGTCIAMFIGVAGNIVFTPEAGGTNVTLAVAASQYLPIRASRILSTGTTATGIHALY